MAEDRVKRKDLWRQLANIDSNDWTRAAEHVGFVITAPSKGSSHVCSVRKPGFAVTDIRGLVTTLYGGMKKRKDVHERVFKAFLTAGIAEDDIWKGLRMLK